MTGPITTAAMRSTARGCARSAGSRRSAARGRRGRRWPVTYRGERPAPRIGPAGPQIRHTCALCGAEDAELVYPANTTGEAPVSEFSCTSGDLALHDDIVRCRECGMVSSIPAMAPERILDSYAEMTDEAYLAEEEGRRELFRWVLGRVDGYLLPGRRLVEVGSNAGVFLSEAERAGFQARGVEPSRWAVETGRRLFGVDIEQGTAETLAAGDGADAIVMLDVLEHLVDPLAALTHLRGVVDSEGLVAISTINAASLHARLRRGAWPWFIRPHLHYFTPETLDAMLSRAGFELVEWAVVPRTFHVSYIADRMASSSALGRAAQRATRVADPRVPVGWLGDVVLALARPA